MRSHPSSLPCMGCEDTTTSCKSVDGMHACRESSASLALSAVERASARALPSSSRHCSSCRQVPSCSAFRSS
jgi:hypothetical protein